MTIRNRRLFSFIFHMILFSPFLNASCIPVASTGNVDQNFTCTGNITAWQYFYGGSDKVALNSVTGNTVYWLDDATHGSVIDGNDAFIAYESLFNWVFGFGGDDRFEVYDSNFSNIYADTNPNWVDQRGNDTIYIENSVSNGWILGGNDSDTITIKDSRVSFVAAGYSDILSDLPGYIDYTPYDGNDTIILDNVDFGEPNYYYTTRPGAVEGGKEDDLIVFKNGGSAYGVTGGHGNDKIIVEDDMLFNVCAFTNDRSNTVACGIYGDEPYASEPNATTIARHGNDEIIIHAGDLSGIVVEAGHGSDTLTIFDGVTLLDTNISGGDDRSIADGFVDLLTFDGWSGDLNGSQLQNWETILFDNISEISFLDDNLSTGFEAGVDPAINLPYGLVLLNNSLWKIGKDFKVDGNLHNSAIIDIQDDGNQPTTTLSVENDYSGSSGTIYMDTVLNDASSSISDKIVIKGDTSGTTTLSIKNANGPGGQTPTGDNQGILVVEVHGNSDVHAFELETHSLSAGKYAYRLARGSNGNWYLQSYDNTPTPPADKIVALNSSLTVNSYRAYNGQLPSPGADTSCSGPFMYVLQEDAKHGTLALNIANGSYSYIPDADYNGIDSFSYQITSDHCANVSNSATVSIAINCTSSQSSDSGDAFGVVSMLFMMFITTITRFYFIKKRRNLPSR